MTRRAGLLLLLLGAIGAWIGVRAYRMGYIGDPCERLRERCAHVSAAELDVATGCAVIGLKSFGQKWQGPMCVKALAVLENKGQ
jgi:hypothetical protein